MSSVLTLPSPVHPWDSQGWKIVVSTAVGFGLSTVGIFLRLLSRLLSRKRLDLSDWLIILAYFLKVGLDIVSIFLVRYGIGRHLNVISLPSLVAYFKALYAGLIIYPPCICFIKLSILAFYWSRFPAKHIRYAAMSLSAAVVVWAIACCLVALMACLPIHKSWNTQVPGHCVDTIAYAYGTQVPNIITDFVLLILLLKAVSDSKLSKNLFFPTLGVFIAGLAACVFSIVRLVMLLRLPHHLDLTWYRVESWIWTELEPSVGILAACMPTMRSLLSPGQFFVTRTTDTHAQRKTRERKSDKQSTGNGMRVRATE